jgi:hypothetical protein
MSSMPGYSRGNGTARPELIALRTLGLGQYASRSNRIHQRDHEAFDLKARAGKE